MLYVGGGAYRRRPHSRRLVERASGQGAVLNSESAAGMDASSRDRI